MKNTGIEWTDHTVNFWWGCTKVSPACAHCYAESVSKVFGKRIFGTVPQWGAGKPRAERLEAARREAVALNKQAAAGKWRIIPSRLDSTTAWESQIAAGEFQIAELRSWTTEERLDERFSRHGCTPVHIGCARTAVLSRDWDRATYYRPKVFLNSMSDWLDDEVPIEWLSYLLETIHLCPHLDFQLLTKRPQNWSDRLVKARAVIRNKCDGAAGQAKLASACWTMLHAWQQNCIAPNNVWIGTTVEHQEMADQRIPALLTIPAKVRFLSCEPLLGPVNLRCIGHYPQLDALSGTNMSDQCPALGKIHWVITGGESGGKARPSHPDWFRFLRDQCAAAGVPFFFKQWGEWIPVDNIKHCTSEKAKLDKGYAGHRHPDGSLAIRLGNDHTGRKLDGIKHSAFPI